MLPPSRSSALLLLLCATLTACGESSGPSPSARQLVMTGRAERGLTLQLRVKDGTGAMVTGDAIVRVVVSPTDAATALGDSALLLLRAGTLSVTATLASGSVATTTAVISVPPLVVFDGLAADNSDIYSVALDGGALTRLTTNAGADLAPTSAGSVVLFTSYRNGNGEIYSILLDGTGEQRLTSTRSNETVPALSPDARFVVYASDASGVTKVMIASHDLTGASRLWANSFGTPTTIETSPAWNATSDRVVFVATAGPAGLTSLFMAPAVTGASPALVAGSGSNTAEFEPSWSPDGGRVAYSAPAGRATQIFVRDLSALTVTQLTFGDKNRGQPVWLRDGRLVFVSFSSLTSASLAWLDPADGVVHEIPIAGISAHHPSAVRP